MATNYQRGAAFELRVKRRLEEQGWTVWRTPGSKSPADLIAVKPSRCDWPDDELILPRLRLVQCKSGAKGMTRKARADFRAFAESLGAEAYVWSRGMKEEAA